MARSFFNAIDNLSLQDIESEADLIPLLTTEDEEALRMSRINSVAKFPSANHRSAAPKAPPKRTDSKPQR